MKIEDVRTYILGCPYLDNETAVNVNYIGDGIISYSITENPSYNPIISKDILGNKECQFLFNFDAKLNWTEETQNNINNSNFFNNFSAWLENKNKLKEFPNITGGTVEKIETTTNGYIYMADNDEAIYRISCLIKYTK